MIKQGDCPELMKEIPDNSTSAAASALSRDCLSGDAGFVGGEYLFRRGRFALVTHNPANGLTVSDWRRER